MAPAATTEEPPRDASGLAVPAWQTDPELARDWRLLAGRYIFQRACVDCHGWGPEWLTREEWKAYLEGFPGDHDPDVGGTYADLTAQFLPGRMVPNADQQTDALATFLLSAASVARSAARTEPREPWDGLPRVGEPAPDFRLVDLEGREHTPATYLGQRRLVLVFSRAHW